MIHHFFDHPLAIISYYRFGSGDQNVLCFHGYGMHGRQFKILENPLGEQFTFYGFDLFFHKETKLKDQSLKNVKKGISKSNLANLIKDFCAFENIPDFTLLSYSMGTHYATAIAEELPQITDRFIAIAPSSLSPGALIKMASKTSFGNFLLEKLVLSEKALTNMLKTCKKLAIVDQVGYDILLKELDTPELRFNFYACCTYLRFLETDELKFIHSLKQQKKPIFIFGKRDKMYPPKIGNAFFKKFKNAEVIILDETHEIINQNFASVLTAALR